MTPPLRVMFPVLLLALSATAATTTKFETRADRISYAIGLDIGQSLSRQSVEVNPDLLYEGLKTALAGETPALSEAEVRETLVSLQRQMQEKQMQAFLEMGDKNLKAGEAFLTENATHEGVVTLESGLQYQVITEGNGEKPGPSDTVTVHYTGTLIDGTVFDSSRERGEPASFPVGAVIPGWQEALQLMSPGARWKLFIPATLAYGESGMPPRIEPNSALVFDVEMLESK
jgi:FKBP-type peptidyl-prolyl cis-trans isomerase FklB